MATKSATTSTKQPATPPPAPAQSGHPIADTVKDKLHNTVDTLAEKAALAEASMRDGAARGSESLQANKEKATKAWEGSSIKRYASENPVATAGIAFALGAIAVSLFKKN